MSYLEIVQLALKGRKISQAARDWKMEEMTLGRYVKGARLPDYLTAKKMASEAGISAGEMLEVLAAEEAKRKGKMELISDSFEALLRRASLGWKRVSA